MLGTMAAGAVACGIIETRFPLPFPGMRIGLSNVFYLITVSLFGGVEAISVAALRTLLIFVLSGNVFAAACSAGGLVLSLPLTIFLCTVFDRSISLRAVSVASSAVFNLGQLAVSAAMIGEPRMMLAYPILLVAGSVFGYAVGLSAEKACGAVGRIIR